MNKPVWATAVAVNPEPEPVEPEPEDLEPVNPTGPTTPDPDSIPAPDAVDRVPVTRRRQRTNGTHYYLAAHGGAGASTLAHMDPDGADAKGTWPTHPGGQNVIVVARQTVNGLQAARNLAQQWGAGAAPGVNLLALITTPAAPGKRPAAIARDLRTVAGMFPRHYTTEWVGQRLTEPLDEHTPTKAEQRTIRTIQKLSKGQP